jgi:CheY-like chemotaxis protein
MHVRKAKSPSFRRPTECMKQSILIVDDECSLAEIVAEMLAERGFQVAIAINGALALEQMAVNCPALVLLDWMMPILDGPAVMTAMRSDPALARVPIIIMTATPHAVPWEIQEVASALLAKPFTPAALFAAVLAALPPP